MSPVAFGANGQPPRPPIDASSTLAASTRPSKGQPLEAPLVEDESGVHDPRRAIQRRDDLLRPCQLWHAAGIDEARDFDGADTRSDEAANQFGANIGREHVRLVLEPVARPDLVDSHARAGPHATTLSK